MTATCEPKPLPLLTSSRLKDARACQRRHYFRYIAGYKPAAERDALRFGSLIHQALEAWWSAEPGNRLDLALAILDTAKADPFDLARARAMLIGYDARWGGEVFEVLAVEAEFRAPLTNPQTGAFSRTWEVGGKIDVIVLTPDGRVLIVEHKTSSEDITAGSEYWKRLRIDGQVSVYYDGAKALGYNVAGCLYDVLKKPALKPLKATPQESRKYTREGKLYANQRETDETPEEYFERVAEAILADPNAYFARGEVVRLEADMDEARFDHWQLGRQLREAELAGRYPRNPDACVRYGQTCEYFPVCSGEASLDDPAHYVRTENVHPELSI